MENTSLKLGALFLVSLLFVGVVVPLASADLGGANRAALAKYKAAKADFNKMKGEYLDARSDFKNARQKYGNKHANTLEAAKNFMMKADKATVAHLEVMKKFVESDEFLEQSEKDLIIEEINGDIAWLENKQSEIEAAEDKETLVAIGKDIKEYWNGIKVNFKQYVGKILDSRLVWVFERANDAEAVVVNNIEKAENAGKDVTELNALLDDFRDKIDLAKSEHAKARDAFSGISNLQNADRLFKEGNQFIQSANSYVREAYQDLREVNTKIRG